MVEEKLLQLRKNFFKLKTNETIVHENNIYYPSINNPILKTPLGSPLSYLIVTHLRANYINTAHLLRQVGDDSVELILDGKVLQKMSCKFIDSKQVLNNEKLTDVLYDTVKTKVTKDDLYSDISILMDESVFLNKENAWGKYLNNLKVDNGSVLDKIGIDLSNYGFCYYEKEGLFNNLNMIKEKGLEGDKLDNLVYSVFSTSVPMLINTDVASLAQSYSGIESYSKFGDISSNNKVIFNVRSQDLIGIPCVSSNPIRSVNNFRDLVIDRKKGEIFSFLKTILDQSHDVKKIKKDIDAVTNNNVDNKDYKMGRLLLELDGLYVAKGQTKTITGIVSSEHEVVNRKSKIISKDNQIIIMNKNFTVTNGQHSSAFLTVLYELTVNKYDGLIKLKDKYGFDDEDFADIFDIKKTDPPQDVVKYLNDIVSSMIDNNNFVIDINDVVDYFKNYRVSYELVTEKDVETAQKNILIHNTTEDSSEGSVWVNRNKGFLQSLSDSYKGELFKFQKEEGFNGFIKNNKLTLNIHLLKDLGDEKKNQHVRHTHIKIDALYPYLNFMMNPKVSVKLLNQSKWIEQQNKFDDLIKAGTITDELLKVLDSFRKQIASTMSSTLFKKPLADDSTTSDMLNWVNINTTNISSDKSIKFGFDNNTLEFKNFDSFKESMGESVVMKMMSKLVINYAQQIKSRVVSKKGFNNVKNVPDVMMATNLLYQLLDKSFEEKKKNNNNIFSSKDRYMQVYFSFVSSIIKNSNKEFSTIEVVSNSKGWIEKIDNYIKPYAGSGDVFNMEKIKKKVQFDSTFRTILNYIEVAKGVMGMADGLNNISDSQQITVTKKPHI